MIHESNGVGKVKFSECQGCPETMTTKQQAKNLFNFIILDNII